MLLDQNILWVTARREERKIETDGEIGSQLEPAIKDSRTLNRIETARPLREGVPRGLNVSGKRLLSGPILFCRRPLNNGRRVVRECV